MKFLQLQANSYHAPSEQSPYVYGRWYLRAVPLQASYNDYGSVENIHPGCVSDLFFESLRQDDILQLGVGANPYHDVPVQKDMGVESWLQALQKGRVQVASNYEGVTQYISQAMVREDVWQLMLRLPSENGTLEDFYHDAERYVNVVKNFLDKKDFRKKEEDLLSEDNQVWWSLRANTITYGIREQIHSVVRSGNDPNIHTFTQAVAETLYVEQVYSHLFGQWQPTTNCSQEYRWEDKKRYHEELLKMINKHLSAEV